MTELYDFPKSALLKRVVPKTRIYEQIQATNALRDKFVTQVDQIIWRAKLAPETINLSATKAVPEIQIFRVILKTKNVQNDVLRAIDRAIPFPILFELEHNNQIQIAAAHKRPSEAETGKWVLSDYFRSDWLVADMPGKTLPVALNLGVLYEQLLTTLMPIDPLTEETITERINRTSSLKSKEREINQLKNKLKHETQFNIKMTLHGQLREAQADFEHLKKPD